MMRTSSGRRLEALSLRAKLLDHRVFACAPVAENAQLDSINDLRCARDDILPDASQLT